MLILVYYMLVEYHVFKEGEHGLVLKWFPYCGEHDNYIIYGAL